MPDNRRSVIEVKEVYKDFRLPHEKINSVKSLLTRPFKRNDIEIQHALRGVSFSVKEGDFFGIIGRNGCGKSTLLKMIAGIYQPTRGSISVKGKISPFLELGVGFNPELTGRENVFLNGSLLGFSKREIAQIYDEIVDFSELREFMDQKLMNYSSGMQVRLAFSVAIQAKAGILIIDEVLAVGDEAFQKKCVNVFERYKAEGKTVVFVTHDMESVKKFCNKAILIEGGKIIISGNSAKIADEYSRINQEIVDNNNKKENISVIDQEGLIKVQISDSRGGKTNSIPVGEEIHISIEWCKEVSADRLILDLYKNSGEHIANFITSREGVGSLDGKYSIGLKCSMNVTPGNYFFSVGIWDKDFKRKTGNLNPALKFIVKNDFSRMEHEFGGITLLNHKWTEK